MISKVPKDRTVGVRVQTAVSVPICPGKCEAVHAQMCPVALYREGLRGTPRIATFMEQLVSYVQDLWQAPHAHARSLNSHNIPNAQINGLNVHHTFIKRLMPSHVPQELAT